MDLSDGERILMMRSAVLTQITRLTDGQTDGIGVAYIRAIAYMLSRVKNEIMNINFKENEKCGNLIKIMNKLIALLMGEFSNDALNRAVCLLRSRSFLH